MAIAGFITDTKARTPIPNGVQTVTTGAVTSTDAAANWLFPVTSEAGFKVGSWAKITDGVNSVSGEVSVVTAGNVKITQATAVVVGTATAVAVGSVFKLTGTPVIPVNLNLVSSYAVSPDGASIVFAASDGARRVWTYNTTAAAATALGLLNTFVGATAIE